MINKSNYNIAKVIEMYIVLGENIQVSFICGVQFLQDNIYN